MIRKALASLPVFVACIACGGQTPTSPSDPSALRAAPASIVVAGTTLTLRSELWRDFMPISPPDGKPLIAVARVQTSDGSAVPPSVRATNISVLLNDSVWTAVAMEERSRAETAPFYEVVARDGPKWGPGVSVDVVVSLTDGTRLWLLRAPDQRIGGSF